MVNSYLVKEVRCKQMSIDARENDLQTLELSHTVILACKNTHTHTHTNYTLVQVLKTRL